MKTQPYTPHTIDKHLIRAGWLFFVVFCFSWPSGRLSVLLWGGSTAALLLAGYWLRRDENRVLAIQDILEDQGDVALSELVRNTGLTQAFILRALTRINLQPGCYFVYNPQTGRIVDRTRIQTETITIHEKCANCAATVHLQVCTGESIRAVCTYCGAPLSAESLARLERISVPQQLNRSATRSRRQAGQAFSLPVFILLLIFLPPVAVVYALFKAYQNQQ